MSSILIIEDNRGLQTVLQETFRNLGLQTVSATDGKKGLELLKSNHFDIVLSDMKLPTVSGMEILKYCREELPEMPILLMTAFAEIQDAITALKLGATDYLIKPFSTHEIEIVVKKALHTTQIEREHLFYKQEQNALFDGFLGQSAAMKKVFHMIQRVATTDAVVLITGDSGTGKELVAQAIHRNSNQKEGTFVRVNCAALPETLLESELFGHEKGAFTGAEKKRVGKFELAQNGTIFLDEIGEIPLNMQAKLLRVLQESELERVGGNKIIPINARIITATNRDLKQAIQLGSFREDLYYRLNVIPIEMPPLREKTEDIPHLIKYFIDSISAKMNRPPIPMDDEAIAALQDYHWPGNIRELKNIIERCLVLATSNTLTLLDLPVDIFDNRQLKSASNEIQTIDLHKNPTQCDGGLIQKLESYEKQLIQEACDQCHGIQIKSAELLKIKRTALQYKLKKYGLLNHGKDKP